MRVLVAEDSLVERHLVTGTVEGLGHECLAAADGWQAWELYQRVGANVIISDWNMPVLDGLELCRRVRATEAASYTYFIFLTMLEDKQHALDGMRMGADDYLTKPLDVDDLELCLTAAERVTQLHRELAEAKLEQGRLQGVHLAARTMQHELGNKLMVTVGTLELLMLRAELTPEWHEAGQEALQAVEDSMSILRRLNRVITLQEATVSPGTPTTLDIDRSIATL